MMRQPSEAVQVSIVMPCYNAARHLPASVGSVLAQTYENWELIAINDGSSDDTLAWLQAQTDPRIRVLTQVNQGVCSARNAALAEANGRFIAFLDADDTWSEHFLERMLTALQAHPDAVLAYCGWQNVGLPGTQGMPFIPPDYETPDKAEALFTRCRWPIHAVLVKHDSIRTAGGFDPALKNAEDFALWLKIALEAPIVRVPEVLAFYHFHGIGQASGNHAYAALQHWHVQQNHLAAHPELRASLGRLRAREIMLAELLSIAYERYWKRDFPAARTLFRTVMKQGYGTLSDWKYMLPAWLPESWHRWLIKYRHPPMKIDG